jgi:hypothetical protein
MDTINMDVKGWLKSFVLAHVNPDADSPSAEADRLMPILEKAGGTTTRNSLAMAVRTYGPDAKPKRKKRWTPRTNGNGAAKTNGQVVSSDAALASLAAARTQLANLAALAETLAEEVTTALNLVTKIETETAARAARHAQIRELLGDV